MKRHMMEIFGNYKKLKQGKQYTVAMSRLESSPNISPEGR